MEVQTVQAIASLSLETIHPTFIVTDDGHPEFTTHHSDSLEVPVIDLAGNFPSDIVRQMSEASSEWGIFQLVNHGIPDDVIAKMQRVGKEFFELPQEEKMLVAEVPGSDSVEGYGTKFKMEADGKRGWVDHLFHFVSPPSAVNYQFWPKNPPSYREANEDYANKLDGVADKIFECLSLGLGLKPRAIKDALSGDEQLMYLLKINYYPTCPRPDLALGIMAHTDMSVVTILVHDVSGLQVLQNECWYDVRFIPNALVVFIGEQVEILSNGKYKSVMHRTTVNKEKTRMSFPVFVQPPPEQVIGPIPELISEENPAKYKPKKYKDYAYSRLNRIANGLK